MMRRIKWLGMLVLFLMVSQPIFAEIIGGNPKGQTTLIEFFDYQCPHCRKMSTIVESLIRNNPNLRVVYRSTPVLGSTSVTAARAVLAAQYQHQALQLHKLFMAYPDYLSSAEINELAAQLNLNMAQLEKDQQKDAVTAEIKQNFHLAGELRMKGVPTFFIGKTNAPLDTYTRIDGEVAANILQDAVSNKKQMASN